MEKVAVLEPSWMDDPKQVAEAFTREAEQSKPFTMQDLMDETTDEDLARLRRQFDRRIEDGDPDPRLPLWRRQARALQLRRFALKMRYGATRWGTDSYDRWYRLDEAPSYRLAFKMDASRAALGHRHILRYEQAAPLHMKKPRPPVAGTPGRNKRLP